MLVENLLGHRRPRRTPRVGSSTTYVVTNRALFRWRVTELGTRVRVVSPDDVRAEILDELRAMVEAS